MTSIVRSRECNGNSDAQRILGGFVAATRSSWATTRAVASIAV